MQRNLWASHGLFFSHRLLLALVDAGLERADAYQLVQRNAMRAWDEERDFGELVRADPEIVRAARRRARWRASSISIRRSPTSTAPSTDFADSLRRRNPFMSETATHVGSGKVREIYALDDERLLLVASDRISTFDVVLPTEIPDKGRVLTGLSGYWFARTRSSSRTICSRCATTARSTECERLEMLPMECVVRGYLSGSGWKDYLATGPVCGHRLPDGLVESQQLPGRSSRRRRRRDRPRREHRSCRGRRADRRGPLRRGRAG